MPERGRFLLLQVRTFVILAVPRKMQAVNGTRFTRPEGGLIFCIRIHNVICDVTLWMNNMRAGCLSLTHTLLPPNRSPLSTQVWCLKEHHHTTHTPPPLCHTTYNIRQVAAEAVPRAYNTGRCVSTSACRQSPHTTPLGHSHTLGLVQRLFAQQHSAHGEHLRSVITSCAASVRLGITFGVEKVTHVYEIRYAALGANDRRTSDALGAASFHTRLPLLQG